MTKRQESKWNYGIKTTKQTRSFGDVIGSGSNWKQEEKNRKAAERKAKRETRRANRAR